MIESTSSLISADFMNASSDPRPQYDSRARVEVVFEAVPRVHVPTPLPFPLPLFLSTFLMQRASKRTCAVKEERGEGGNAIKSATDSIRAGFKLELLS